MDSNKKDKSANDSIDSLDLNNQDGQGNDDSKQRKRKRRSKNEQDGRSFKCSHCGKCYLSQPALTNHIKTKHNDDNNPLLKRGRGRPRKNPVSSTAPGEREQNNFKNFFEINETRMPIPSEINNLNVLVNRAFSELVLRYKSQLFSVLETYEKHNLFVKISERHSWVEEKEISTADEIFAKYVCEMFNRTNREYFVFVTKFSLLFRECINKYKIEGQQPFTEFNSADTIPDLCNEFITEFMENNDYFGLDTNEIIELIQQFCYWLYDNKFTTSRLTLLS